MIKSVTFLDKLRFPDIRNKEGKFRISIRTETWEHLTQELNIALHWMPWIKYRRQACLYNRCGLLTADELAIWHQQHCWTLQISNINVKWELHHLPIAEYCQLVYFSCSRIVWFESFVFQPAEQENWCLYWTNYKNIDQSYL